MEFKLSNWILFENQKPSNGQHVFYYFNILGVFEGYYEEFFHEELGVNEEVFHGKDGWLGDGEVTHWMPYVDEFPSPPQ